MSIHDDNSMTGLNRCSFCRATVGHTNDCPSRPGFVSLPRDSELTASQRSELAGQLSESLAIELRKADPLPPLSLHQIESGLMQLLEAREAAEAEGLAPDELKPFDDEIALYMDAQLRKVDGVARSIRAALTFADEAKREEERLAARRKAWTARAERIKEAALYAMQSHGVRVLETATNKLRVQKNGGPTPLEVNAEAVPDEYMEVTITMPLLEWRKLERKPNVFGYLPPAVPVPSMARIRAALAQQVPCPECTGQGRRAQLDESQLSRVIESDPTLCPRCEGKRTVPQNIPGAKLGERGVHLRVE